MALHLWDETTSTQFSCEVTQAGVLGTNAQLTLPTLGDRPARSQSRDGGAARAGRGADWPAAGARGLMGRSWQGPSLCQWRLLPSLEAACAVAAETGRGKPAPGFAHFLKVERSYWEQLGGIHRGEARWPSLWEIRSGTPRLPLPGAAAPRGVA